MERMSWCADALDCKFSLSSSSSSPFFCKLSFAFSKHLSPIFPCSSHRHLCFLPCRLRHAPPRPFFFSLPPQLAERAEYFWDDGTAEPEWFVDRGSSGGFAGGRPWAQSTASAAAQLAGVFLGIAVFIGGPAYIIGDSLKPAALPGGLTAFRTNASSGWP